MSLTSLFKRLGAPLANSRWSWGALGKDGSVYLRVWQDGTIKKDGKLLVQVTHLEKYGDGRGRNNLGYSERLAHVDQIRRGAKTYLVMCWAKDPSIHEAPREIKSFNSKEIFVGGAIHEIDGDFWVEIVDRVLASAAAAKTPMHQCPCCDYFSLERRGEYDICRVCFWEDCGQDLDKLDQHSGPNHMTLREARQNFSEFGACDRAMLKNVIPVKKRAHYAHQSRAAGQM